MAPSAHALLAPSASARWTRCAASAYWSAHAPAGDTASDYAQEGTWAHALAERQLLDGPDAWFTTEEVAAIVRAGLDPEDFRAPVAYYADYVRGLSGTRLVEQALFLAPVTTEEGARGTTDALVMSDAGVLHICDLKYGRGVKVNALDNTQLIIYAGAALAEFGWMADFQTVTLHIVQPRLDHVDSWTLPAADLLRRVDEIKARAARALAVATADDKPGPGDYAPGPEACRWCPACHSCEALTCRALQVAGLDWPPGLLDGAGGKGPILEFILSHLDLIKRWMADVTDYARDYILAGGEVPGYKVVAGRPGNREWSDEAAAEKMMKGWKVPADARYVKKLISPTAAEKLHKMKTLTDEQWGELSTLVSRAPGKPTLVSADDKRPALTDKPSADAYPVEKLDRSLCNEVLKK